MIRAGASFVGRVLAHLVSTHLATEAIDLWMNTYK